MRRLKLRSDSYFTIGTGAQPVDLVSKATGDRTGLNEDEAAVAMLLMEGLSEDSALATVQNQGVSWDQSTLDTCLSKLEAARLLERSGRARIVPSTGDVEALELMQLDAPSDTLPDGFSEGEVTDAGTDVDDDLEDLDDATTVDLAGQLLLESSAPQTVPEVAVLAPAESVGATEQALSRPAAAAAPLPPPPVPAPDRMAPAPPAAPEVPRAPGALASAPAHAAEPLPALRADLEARPLPDGTVLLCDPLGGTQQRLAEEVLKLAYLFDGVRDVAQVVAAARAAGINVTPQIVQTVAARLESKGLIGAPPPFVSEVSGPMGPLTGPMPAVGSSSHGVREQLPPGIEAATLATALLLLRDRRYAEAQAAVQPVLERNPENAQALTLLQLIQTEAARDQTSRSKTRLRRAVIFVVLALCLLGLLLFPVPRELVVPCIAETVPVGSVKATLSGKVKLGVVKGQLVKKGQLVGTIFNQEAARAAPPLREQLADDKDLLRIMRTGGDDDDAAKTRAAVKRLSAQLDEAACDGDDCRARVERLKRRLQTAKRKVKYCEWKAYKGEVAELAAQVKLMTAKLAKLELQIRLPVKSEVAGLVSEVFSGKKIRAGQHLLKLVNKGRFEVTARVGEELPQAGAPIDLTLARGAARQSYAAKAERLQAGQVQATIEADVSKLLLGGTCTAKMTAGRTLLIKSLLR